MSVRLAPLQFASHRIFRQTTRFYTRQQAARTDVWGNQESRRPPLVQTKSSQSATAPEQVKSSETAVSSDQRTLESFWADPIDLGQYDNLDDFLTPREDESETNVRSSTQSLDELLSVSRSNIDSKARIRAAQQDYAEEADEFFSSLSSLLESRKKSQSRVYNYIVNSKYFLNHLEVQHLGLSELDILDRAFIYASIDLDRNTKELKSIAFARATEILRHYQARDITISQASWATLLTSGARHLSIHSQRNSRNDRIQHAAVSFRFLLDLDHLLHFWALFFQAHGAAFGAESLRLHSSDAQQRFFVLIPEWQCAQDLSADERVFYSALMTSSLVFEGLGKRLSLPPSEAEERSQKVDLFHNAIPPYLSFARALELSLLSKLVVAVSDPTSNRVAMRLGIAKLSLPDQKAQDLLHSVVLLKRYENDILEHPELGNPISRPGGLLSRNLQQVSKWIETAKKPALSKMHQTLYGNGVHPLLSSMKPLAQKMSLRLVQIERRLPGKMWDECHFNDGFCGEDGTFTMSPAVLAIILRQTYRSLDTEKPETVVRKFETAWQSLDLARTRIPHAFWWLRMKLNWRLRKYRLAFEDYKVAIFDLEMRSEPDQRPVALLRLANNMLCLAARYGNISHAVGLNRGLHAKGIEPNANTYRWNLRVYLKQKILTSVKPLLKAYLHHGGKNIYLRDESSMLFVTLVRRFPKLSSAEEMRDWLQPAIDAVLCMREPDIMERLRLNRDKIPGEPDIWTARKASQKPSTAELERLNLMHLSQAYDDMARILIKADCRYKVILLAILHQHFHEIITMGNLRRLLEPQLLKVGSHVKRAFATAPLSEQVLLLSGPPNPKSSTAKADVDSSAGSCPTTTKVKESAIAEHIRAQLEIRRTKPGLEKNAVWQPLKISLLERILPDKENAILMTKLDEIREQTAAEEVTGLQQLEQTSRIQQRRKADKTNMKTNTTQTQAGSSLEEYKQMLDFSPNSLFSEYDDKSSETAMKLLMMPKIVNGRTTWPGGRPDDSNISDWRVLSMTSTDEAPQPLELNDVGSPYDFDDADVKSPDPS